VKPRLAVEVSLRRLTRRRSHWGWGYEDEQPSREELRAAAAGLAAHLGFGSPEPELPVPLEAVELPAPRLALPPGLPLTQDPHARALHAHGRSYLDVVRGFRGRFQHPPDAVAAPRDEDELRAVLEWAAAEDLAVIPAGGGTSVVGGIDARPGDHAGAVTLSLRAMNRVLEVDAVSRAARIQAGATGPALERRLAEHGLTLRFYPQSFELATLGGWLATRAGGHFATGPTHVDDLVESIRAITATGERWESRRLPASGAGPSPDRLLLGSEGTLAVITEAWMRVQPRPAERRGASVAFADFAAGAEAVRAIVQDGLRPANCRLIDAREAALTLAGDGSAALLVLGFESAGAPLGEQFERAAALCREHGGDVTPSPPTRGGAGGSWREAFLRAPYVRDTLVAMGVLSETFESAVTWNRLGPFVDQVIGATREALRPDGLVTVRLTHAYPDGAAPYFTVIAPTRPGEEEQQWHTVKRAAADAILAAGGTITHHHAVGREHRPWYDRQRPDPFAAALRAAKAALDPDARLNPGLLLDP
jgi:alkyldihydroxyacetonephosphate synthase